tara:strand:- start:119 stop:553 length:435 start_codon:yes stop_codon:yes gene_type:complete
MTSMPTLQKCIFCDIISGKTHSTIIYSDEKFLCLMDKYPISKGHFLVIPKHHYYDVFEMPLVTVGELFELSVKLGKIAKDVLNAQGVNIGQNNGKVANQIVPHVHVHVIPRYITDSNQNNWSPGESSDKDLNHISNILKNKVSF